MRPSAARVSAVLTTVGVLLLGACSGDDGSSAEAAPETGAAAPRSSADPTIAAAPATSSPPSTAAATTVPTSTARLTEAPTDAAGFATALSAAELTIRDPGAAPDALTEAGRRYQLLLRALADVPELDEEVLAALDPSVRPTIERIVRARQFLQARNAARDTPSEPPTDLPAWTIVEPEPVDVLLGHYREAESITGIPWYWLAAIHLQETRMGRIQGVSSAGAIGPMQFLPTTWAECCTGDPLVTRDAIIGAATYLAQSGGPADMNAAVYQYNPNEGYVAVVTAYAQNLRDVPQLYAGYHAFQVFFGTSAGTVRLPIGYSQAAPIDAATYLAANPADAA